MEDTGITFRAVPVYIIMIGEGDGGTAYPIGSEVVLSVLRAGRCQVRVERDLVTCVVAEYVKHQHKWRRSETNRTHGIASCIGPSES